MGIQPLPIDNMLPEIVEALERENAVVVEAPPGAGKTTRVPVAIDRAGLGGGRRVVVLQPRRVAARAAARRIAWENGWRLGEEVGYHVRFDKKFGSRTRILVVTQGLFVSMLQRDPFMEKVGVVVFDEFHERSLDADLALAMSRRVQQQVRADLRLVVMSATLDGQPVSSFLDGCPQLTCAVRCHPVDVSYARSAVSGDPAVAAASAVRRVLETATGDVLVFLPGVAWINRCERELGALSSGGRYAVLKLHGSLSATEQDQALQPCDQRKVILATNIAETSLTIDGVRLVIDSGLARTLRFDRGAGLNRLETSRISLASAEQRAGRAGRQAPGRCVRLWTEAEHGGLREAETPEISRLELSKIVLQLLSWGESDLLDFPWFEKPPQRALDEAADLLQSLGALNAGGLTKEGRVMAELPITPRLARLLLESWNRGCLAEAAWVAAGLSEGFPVRDGAVNLVALTHDQLYSKGGRRADSRMNRIGKVRDDLIAGVSRHFGSHRGRSVSLAEAMGRTMIAAFPDRIARTRHRGADRAVMVGGGGLRLGERGLPGGTELFVAAEVKAGDRRRHAEARVSHLVPIEAGWLPDAQVRTEDHLEVDSNSGRVKASRRRLWRDLVISESEAVPDDSVAVAAVLARAAAQEPDGNLGLDRPEVLCWLARLRSLARWRPELGLPVFDRDGIVEMLPVLCQGRRSLAELRRLPIIKIFSGSLSSQQLAALDREAPERLRIPSGSRVRLTYELGKPPVLAARIQELFGLTESPTVAGGRVRVMVHLLAPNGRPQQITDDLASFWANTYHQVRADLRGRYPKHYWPEDPHKAEATARIRPRRKSR